ncbi:DNA gyrase subunit A [Candidatus Marinamargulisbacteria bacterium SCGC AG-343-D04]|nr:DNA gyrase subunit A [Candidatus Marinamargulisbacteria bacterium SCGC AG-343-D04]
MTDETKGQDELFDSEELEQAEVGISTIDINDEMKSSYLEYAMSVIVGRALPDVRDGLKPVHRRILYSMYNSGFTSNKAYKKCARIVGDVLGRYHPHGDTAVYDSLVRMAQDFSLRYMFIDGQGNYGSVDGDNAAAMRYTEARMSKISMQLLEDIEKNTVDFSPNFDESLQEPDVLPARLPGLLLNGTSGIAVGMATNIPPHNLVELVDGVCALIDNPDIDMEGLMEHVKGPDFPTSGIICGTEGIKKAYATGRGSVVIRAKISYETTKRNRDAIIVDELPYQVNKANLIIKIAELVQDKKIPGISDLRDESDRNGMRIFIELKRDASRDVVLNQLFKHTQLQNSFGINMVALVNRIPKLLNLKEVLSYYILHRKEVVVRRTTYDLNKAKDRLHILEGLRIALENIDDVIALIKKSKNADEAREGLMSKYALSEKQATSILEMRLQRLTGLERDKIEAEYKEIVATIADLEDILANESRVFSIIKDEQLAVKEQYGDDRRTVIGEAVHEMSMEDLIPNTQVAVLISKNGFVKRMNLDQFKKQNRGGRGINSMKTRDEDSIEHLLITNTHDYLLCFSTKGRVFKIKAHQVPETSRQSKGVSLAHFLHFEEDELLSVVIDVKEFSDKEYLFMTTKKGVVKKTSLDAFVHFKNKPIAAINLDDGDSLEWVKKTNGDKDIMLVTSSGMLIRFEESQVRGMGRTSRGIRGIKIREEDELISMNFVEHDDEDSRILVITRYGYGKNIRLSEFRCQNRGGVGVKCLSFRKSIKDDRVQDAVVATREHEIIIVTESGTLCRQSVGKISTQKRGAQGVRIMKCDDSDFVTAMSVVEFEDEEEDSSEKLIK